MRLRFALPAAAMLLLLGGGVADAGRSHHGSAAWVTSWAASPQSAMPGSPAATGYDDQTIRNVVFASTGGSTVRVRLTNAFGAQPLQIGRAAIGLAGGGGASSDNRQLSFGGQQSVLIPPGAEVLSDPVRLAVPALHDLAVSVYVPQSTGPATGHSDAQETNYVAAGDHALDADGAAFTTKTQSWEFVDSVDVTASRHDLGTVVALGDSITDGANSTVDADARWPNDLARRIEQARGVTVGIADEGISGNRVLNDSRCFGVNVLARFDRDVIARPDARTVIFLEGINDIGFSQMAPGPDDTSVGPEGSFGVPFLCFQPITDVSAGQIISGYEQVIAQAHDDGLKIIGGTLTPFKGAPYYTAAAEAKREIVNNWIRTSGAFDGVVDFDRTVADPSDPLAINPAYDSGDHLHPNDAGYRAMANAIDLRMLLHPH